NTYYTVISEDKPLKIRDEMSVLPHGFPVPAGEAIAINKDGNSGVWPLWRNTGIFTKTVSFEGFNSFTLKNYDYLTDSVPELRQAVIQNPLVYLSDRLLPTDILTVKKHCLPERSDVYADSKTIEMFSGHKLLHNSNDTVIITGFGPNHLIAETHTVNDQIITFMQSDYPGWNLFIDDKPAEHFTGNILFISALLPAGKHIVEFRYSNNLIIITFIIALSAFVLLLLLLFFLYIKRSPETRKWLFIPALLTVLTTASAIVLFRASYKDKVFGNLDRMAAFCSDWYEKNKDSKITAVFNIDNPSYLFEKLPEKMREGVVHNMTFGNKDDIPHFMDFIRDADGELFLYGRSNRIDPPEIRELILERYPFLVADDSAACVQIFARSGENIRKKLLCAFNDMEHIGPGWNVNPVYLDSSVSFSGKYSCMLDSVNIFGSTYRINCKGFPGLSGSEVFISVMANILSDAEAFLVFSLENKEGSKEYVTACMQDFKRTDREWSRVVLAHKIRTETGAEDIIKIYVWNKGKQNLYIDDFDIMIY
ncbi:MAG: hypothetical protein KJ607_04725, partial [Bacteroidetes bacterium]|nr:hypothetical protein [Bacteroidota bacterium]